MHFSFLHFVHRSFFYLSLNVSLDRYSRENVFVTIIFVKICKVLWAEISFKIFGYLFSRLYCCCWYWHCCWESVSLVTLVEQTKLLDTLLNWFPKIPLKIGHQIHLQFDNMIDHISSLLTVINMMITFFYKWCFCTYLCLRFEYLLLQSPHLH